MTSRFISRLSTLAFSFITLLSFLFPTLSASSAHAEWDLGLDLEWLAVDRRESPTKTKEGLLAFPIYTHLPGIGSAFGFGFLSSNILKSRTNALGAVATGDTSLAAFGITEVHLVPNNVIMNFYGYSTRIPFQLYDRGPSSTEDGYVNLLRKEYGATAEMHVHLWERRVQFAFMFAPSRLEVSSASSITGDKYNNRDGAEVGTLGTTARLQLDLTDDDQDPRKGVKIQIIRHDSLIYDRTHSDYDSLSAMFTALVPLPESSVLAFNVFRSSASVHHHNTMSEGELREAIGFNCDNYTNADERSKCQAAEDRRVEERLAENRFGTAALLGGPTQLRGYPVGRFRGSEAIFYATELRWNLTDEDTPFDLGFIKGSRSLLQIAPFLEFGAVVDPPDTVEQAPLKATYGVGFRMGFSGALVRADAGLSSEGPQFTFFFGYPWDLSIL